MAVSYPVYMFSLVHLLLSFISKHHIWHYAIQNVGSSIPEKKMSLWVAFLTIIHILLEFVRQHIIIKQQ